MTWFDFGVLVALVVSIGISLLHGLAREMSRSECGSVIHTGDAVRRPRRWLLPQSLGPLLSALVGFLIVFGVVSDRRVARRPCAFVCCPRIRSGSGGSRAGVGLRPGKRVDHLCSVRRCCLGGLTPASARTFLARRRRFRGRSRRGTRAAAL